MSLEKRFMEQLMTSLCLTKLRKYKIMDDINQTHNIGQIYLNASHYCGFLFQRAKMSARV